MSGKMILGDLKQLFVHSRFLSCLTKEKQRAASSLSHGGLAPSHSGPEYSFISPLGQ